MDNWIFPLPKFNIFGHRFDLFQSGSLTVNRPRFLGLNLAGPKAYFIFGAVAFCLLALVVVWIRRSNFGQRLLAMKDSPAACATLGLNLTFTKLGVFTVSAAIAGLGGAVYGGALRTADAQQLQFFSGLAILMVMVIGGINSIGAALFSGIFVGTPIVSNLFHSWKQLPTVLPGVAGIGLGKNPNGFIASDMRPQWDVLLEEPLAIAGVIGAELLVWMLRVTHSISNWQYAIAAIAVLALTPYVGGAIVARRKAAARAAAAGADAGGVAVATAGANGGNGLALAGARAGNGLAGDGNGGGRPLSGPLEWLGVTQPFKPEDVAAMDEVLALPALPTRGPNGAA
jgi:branched-chain amino acid transport system permease protein